MRGTYRRIWRAYSKRPWRVIFGFAAAIASPLVSLTVPSLVRKAVDTLAAGGTAQELLPLAVAIVGVTLAAGVLMWTQRFLLVGVSRHLEHELRTATFEHLLRLPASWFTNRPVGDLLTRLGSDVGAVRMAFGPALMYVASTATITVAAVALMFRIHPWLTLAALTLAPAVAATTKFFGSRIHSRWTAAQEELSRFTSRLQEHLLGLRILRAFNCEEHEKSVLAQYNRQYFGAARQLIAVQSLFYPLLHFLIGLGFVLILGIGGYLVTRNRMSLGQFVEFNLYLSRLTWPMIAVGWVANLWQRGSASLRRLEALLSQPPELLALEEPQTLPRPSSTPISLALVDLHFRYTDTSPPVLRGINLAIPAGKRVAILGEVGSGKSTLLNLIPRLLTPPRGAVFLDGRDVLEWDLQELRRAAVLVPQSAFLFSATIRENICLGMPDATDDEVWEAAARAGLLPDLASFPEGLNTIVGERGVTLSGGQRQRVALARALLLRPSLLLLDDCLSAVDRRTEQAIVQGLPQSTLVFATHRILAAKNADWVVVLERGRITVQGPPEVVSQSGGAWAQLLTLEELEEEIQLA